ncbi:hypothetical protein CBR_g50921 [Chara braunii]|uniref:Uncharacterized protein n=1 Tax=Chara braunii TaxID=69332 RepID=A0A388M7L6_CHABU|nr:hypothetical protein CBR_g50921 [Chara braunii]|eukprot:GBG90578.1 hypothetical protein CBR_g50921 [Chara braunii]
MNRRVPGDSTARNPEHVQVNNILPCDRDTPARLAAPLKCAGALPPQPHAHPLRPETPLCFQTFLMSRAVQLFCRDVQTRSLDGEEIDKTTQSCYSPWTSRSAATAAIRSPTASRCAASPSMLSS